MARMPFGAVNICAVPPEAEGERAVKPLAKTLIRSLCTGDFGRISLMSKVWLMASVGWTTDATVYL